MARPNRPLSSSPSGLVRVLTANATVTIFGLAISLLLPLSLSPVEYGYWQLYALYVSYAGLFMFGFNDGYHLTYAGSHYDEATLLHFRSFRVVVFFMSLCGAVGLACLAIPVQDDAKRFIVRAVAIYVLMAGINGFCSYTNQNTLRFKQYSRGIVLERLSFLLAALALVAAGVQSYEFYITASVLACLVLFLYNLMSSTEVFRGPRTSLRVLKSAVLDNFSSGFLLMCSILLNQSMLVVGRLVIEARFGIAVFGAYSLALAILNIAGLVMVSISLVLFPTLKRATSAALAHMRRLVDGCSSIIGATLMLTYFVAWAAVTMVYDAYVDMLAYLPFLFPVLLFQGKFQLLVVNGFKLDRRMRGFFLFSLFGVVLELALCWFSAHVFGTVSSVVIASVIGYIIHYYVGVHWLRAASGSRVPGVTYVDVATAVLFVASCMFPGLVLGITGWQGLLVSFLSYLVALMTVTYALRVRIIAGFRELHAFLNQ